MKWFHIISFYVQTLGWEKKIVVTYDNNKFFKLIFDFLIVKFFVCIVAGGVLAYSFSFVTDLNPQVF